MIKFNNLPEQQQWRLTGVFILNFEHISHYCYFEHVIAG